MNFLRFIILVIGCTAALLRAAIPVEMRGTPSTFDSPPLTNEWATLHVPFNSPNVSNSFGLDALVQSHEAGAITNPLTTSTIFPSSGSGSLAAMWSSPAHLLETRPTGNSKALLLMARLENRTGRNLAALHVSYLMGDPVQFYDDDVELPGYHVYYSLTGHSNTWQHIPKLSGYETNARVSALIELGAWPPNGELFLLWADDNNVVATDVSNTIDDFIAEPLRLAIEFGDTSQIRVSWPGAAANYDLWSNTNAAQGAWQRVTEPSSLANGVRSVVLPNAGQRFFTLQKNSP